MNIALGYHEAAATAGGQAQGVRRLPARLAAAIALVSLVALACLSAACDGLPTSAPIPSTCSQIGAQCQLPGGPLGVCQEKPCDEGAVAPCFACTPQH